MPVTQSLNSKANVKKLTNQDAPFNAQQPVLSSFYADSTANQTVINLSFSVDTVNLADQFFLFVDGNKLRLGTGKDYNFTSIDAQGRSSQVTLTSPLNFGTTIQAYNLGLKKESEFGIDNRLVDLYEAQSEGFQGFVKSSAVMNATSATGAPAAGTFYSTVQNRTPMVDFTQDLKARLGVERLFVPRIMLSQTESGPNGEPVYLATNDSLNQIRYVGPGWLSVTNIQATQVYASGNIVDYVEITFYGTGLNALTLAANTGNDWRVSVDGGAEGSNVTAGSYSAVDVARGYNAMAVLPIVSGLSLGVHTVKIRNNNASSPSFDINGFDVITVASGIVTNPGTGYVGNKKIAVAAQSTLSPTAAVTGTRGGRVLQYLSSSGIVSQAFTAVNASSAFMTSADHTNEEVARVYNFREFGVGRTDDFSAIVSSSYLSFTLDDGTSSLVGYNITTVNNSYYANAASQIAFGSGGFVEVTFVGCGIDFLMGVGGSTGSATFTVDGSAAGTLSIPANNQNIITVKVASGLPYGTHVARVTYNSGSLSFEGHKVYQPKKPALPSGAVELADFNAMATYVANTTAGVQNVATGVLRKVANHEFIFQNGTGGTVDWTQNVLSSGNGAVLVAGCEIYTDRVNANVSFTFTGTGFDFRTYRDTNRTSNISVTLNGLALTTTNFPTISATNAGFTFSTSTGILNQNGASQSASGFAITGLPYGTYTLKLNNNTASSTMSVDSVDIITPVHTFKSQVPFDQQNSLTVGSCGIADTRKFSPSKESNSAIRNVSQGFGITTISSSATSYLPLPEMGVVHTSKTGRIEINYSIILQNNTNSGYTYTIIMLNGQPIAFEKPYQAYAAAAQGTISDSIVVNVPVGSTNRIDLGWRANTGTMTAYPNRNITVKDI